ncbi:MAG: DUF6364 family protein [Actinomycetota bacterium]|nr:type II toxin-antitoxin system VapB family antitoxin [Actinomycetota bacterium]
MKTTLNLDDALLRSAKKIAAERGTTLTSVVEEALRAVVNPRDRRSARQRFRWVVVSGSELPTADLADRKALYDIMERRH